MKPENLEKQDPSTKLILIVDDEETILDFLKFYISKQGFKIDTATDGVQAIEKVTTLQPDLVILDAMLPKKSGYEVVKILQQKYKNIPIIVISGRYRDFETQMMFKHEPNVKDFFVKPVQPDLLISKIHSILNTKPKEETIAEQKIEELKKQIEQ